jgi:hypothetical protein
MFYENYEIMLIMKHQNILIANNGIFCGWKLLCQSHLYARIEASVSKKKTKEKKIKKLKTTEK